jgi:hypothetical protein
VRPALALLVLALGCATKEPVLYPNPQLERVGGAAAAADVDDCMRLAQDYVRSDAAREAAGRTAGGAVVGGATGAAVGAVVGSVGRGAAAGAAGGAAGGLTRWVLHRRDPDPLVRAYAERCLRERGYDVLGWR